MGWQVGYDSRWQRDVGYGVPAICDKPACGADIDRGLSQVCGGKPYGGEEGCGLFFCDADLFLTRGHPQLCERCADGKPPFSPTMDTQEWMTHKLTDETWEPWRSEHPDEVRLLVAATGAVEKEQIP